VSLSHACDVLLLSASNPPVSQSVRCPCEACAYSFSFQRKASIPSLISLFNECYRSSHDFHHPSVCRKGRERVSVTARVAFVDQGRGSLPRPPSPAFILLPVDRLLFQPPPSSIKAPSIMSSSHSCSSPSPPPSNAYQQPHARAAPSAAAFKKPRAQMTASEKKEDTKLKNRLKQVRVSFALFVVLVERVTRASSRDADVSLTAGSMLCLANQKAYRRE
jgi:hypothetical protein